MAKDKTDIWLPIYVGDYLADTMHLTTEQHGAYFLLIMAYWKNRGPLIERRLKSIVRIDDEGWIIIKEFFDTTTDPGKWIHHRIEKELKRVGYIRDIRSEAGKLGGNPNFKKGKQNPYYTDKQKDNQKDKQKISIPQSQPHKDIVLNKSIQTDISTGTIEPKKELVLKKLQEAFLKFPDMRYQQQIKVFVEANLFKKNGDAIIQALNSLIKSQQKIINPKAYLEKILGVENGNFNERESVQEHEEHKKPIPIESLKGLGSVLQGMANAL